MRTATRKELEEMIGNKMSQNLWPGAWGSITTYNGEEVFSVPEDAEGVDKMAIKLMIGEYFNKTYPEFEPQIISTFEGKQYYLPALKVLKLIDGEYYSPGYTAKWENMELVAECRDMEPPWAIRYAVGGINNLRYDTRKTHSAPSEDCDCGIYGSVNMDEIKSILYKDEKAFYQNPGGMVLCIIEPFPDANTHITRKGWKTSHAFISEIVGETISIEEASYLLSMAWQRNIDARRVYENR